jgi:hypothetical protein
VDLYEIPPDPRKKFPLWRIDALAKDIERASANIKKFEDHIAEELRLIEERKEQIAICEERDAAIAEWEKNRGDSDFPSGE